MRMCDPSVYRLAAAVENDVRGGLARFLDLRLGYRICDRRKSGIGLLSFNAFGKDHRFFRGSLNDNFFGNFNWFSRTGRRQDQQHGDRSNYAPLNIHSSASTLKNQP